MHGRVKTDMLFVGLTRPPMFLGVSYMYFFTNFFVCLLAYILTTSFKFFVLMLPIHLLGYYLCSKEPLFIELFMIKSSKCSRTSNRLYHGANSYDLY